MSSRLLEARRTAKVAFVLLGHARLSSTELYTQVATKTISKTPSPLDQLRLEIVPPG